MREIYRTDSPALKPGDGIRLSIAIPDLNRIRSGSKISGSKPGDGHRMSTSKAEEAPRTSSAKAGEVLRTSSSKAGEVLRTSSSKAGEVLRTSSSKAGEVLQISSSKAGEVFKTPSSKAGDVHQTSGSKVNDGFQQSVEPYSFRTKGRKSRFGEPSERDEIAKRVLAPFLARYKKKSKQKMMGIKEGYEHVYQQFVPREVLSRLARYFTDNTDLSLVIREMSEIMKTFTKSDGVLTYMVDPSNEHIVLCTKFDPQSERNVIRYLIEPGTTVAAYVAFTQEFVLSPDILGDPRFPEGVPVEGMIIKSVLCVPVITNSDNDVLAVIELYKSVNRPPFTENDLQMAVTLVGWMGAAIHQNDEKIFAKKENELTKHLLTMLHLFFSGVIPYERFVSDIVLFAKTTIGAERGSFHQVLGDVVEGTDEDIFTEVYEEGLEGRQTYKKKAVQRYAKNGYGIVGHCIRTGKTIMLEDAYQDDRFNRTSDIMGYRSRTLLAVPIKSSLQVYGVLKMDNKMPAFTDHDEQILNIYALYSLLACQFQRKSEELQKTLRRYEGNIELTLQQMRPCPDDVEMLRTNPILSKKDMPHGYFGYLAETGFDWFIGDRLKSSVQYILFSITHVLGFDYFDMASLIDFVLMAKKTYRANPYHNFIHAFTVFHCSFNIIIRNRSKFSMMEKAALLVATLCHDADHFGCTNSFLGMTGNWLADLYQESTLEHHHFDMCMMLVRTTNLFYKLTADEFRQMTKLIESLILATDLAAHFRLRGFMTSTIKSRNFNWNNPEHKMSLLHLIMTCCDISGQCKPFTVARQITEWLYIEFYNQGDREKVEGVEPLAMMDRKQGHLVPLDQIRFLTIVCIPCLEMLAIVLPNTDKLLNMCLIVRKKWKLIQDKHEEMWLVRSAYGIDQKFLNQ